MFVEDLAPFFADFPAVDATLDGQPLRVIFDRTYIEQFTGISSTDPRALAPSALVGAATKTSQLVVPVVGGNTYRVRSVQPDGTGVSLLQLELQ